MPSILRDLSVFVSGAAFACLATRIAFRDSTPIILSKIGIGLVFIQLGMICLASIMERWEERWGRM